MPRESSPNPNSDERLTSQLRLLNEAAAGRIEDLECPNCGHAAVSVWFTHPAADMYRTWFICADCDFHARAQNTIRPSFFSEDRVNTDLEEHDLSILKQSLFKRPPQRLM
jgi:hypothetical protein